MSTIDTNKFYTVKSSANRALKAAGNPEGYYVNQTAQGWHVAKPVAEAKPAKAKKEPSEKRNGNCKRVWDLADEMVDAKRKDVIAACVEAGINLGTARTQYQSWFVAQRG